MCIDMAVSQSGMTLHEVADEFESVEGIEVNRADIDTDEKIMVKVMEEDAMGQYYKLARTLPVETWAETRDCFDFTVFDAFVKME